MLVRVTCDDATRHEPRVETGQCGRRVQNLKQLALVICQDNARPTRTHIVKRERRAGLDSKKQLPRAASARIVYRGRQVPTRRFPLVRYCRVNIIDRPRRRRPFRASAIDRRME